MSARKTDLNEIFGATANKIKISAESPEDEDEKRLRLRKEWWTFVARDLIPTGLAFVLVTVAFGVSVRIVTDAKQPTAQVDRAWGVIAAVVGSIGGFIFGKATAK